MEYYAHSLQDENGQNLPQSSWQTLKEHLENTAALSQNFALPRLKNAAYFLGLLHDVGKCQPTFQKRLAGDKTTVDHAVCGAKEAVIFFGENLGSLLAYPLIGHHSGLPDRGAKGKDNSDASALFTRLGKTCEDYSAYKALIDFAGCQEDVKKEISAYFNSGAPMSFQEANSKAEFLVRYLYSCLTDADFLDTERFVLGKEREGFCANFLECDGQLEKKFLQFHAETPLQKARSSLKNQALENLKKSSCHIHLLDMPTGSGKTLCSVQLALKQLIEKGKKRIIYVIPYTSIIEQTAETLHEIFPNLTILQHHSNFDFDEKEEMSDGEVSAKEKLKKSTENWDAPLIITTNVQFFESIYSNRVSKLRKFHNMSDSVIVFDEIHTLPIANFVQCIKAVKNLAEDFGSEIFFLTATMPNFVSLCQDFAKTNIEMDDLLPDKSEYPLFDKCTFEVAGEVDVVEKINRDKSTLVVSNSKKGALELYQRYDGKKFYLSTYMTALHRLEVISKIRAALKNGEKFAVFSTSLIEAGVDLDFDEVWRELAGVDNILQSAGRCNREGRKEKAASKVFVYSSKNKPIGELAQKADVTTGLIEEFGASGLMSKECVMAYFERVYKTRKNTMKMPERRRAFDIDFKTIAKEFEMIDSITKSVVVPVKDEEILREIEKLKTCGFANKRKLQKATASVSKYELDKLIACGVVSEHNGVFLLESEEFYSPEFGLDLATLLEKDFIYG